MRLVIQEDNQATIKVAEAGFSAKMRHIQRTHKVNLSSLKEQLEQPEVDLRYIKTDLQAADVFTKALEPQKWQNAMDMLNLTCFDPCCSETSKARFQQEVVSPRGVT